MSRRNRVRRMVSQAEEQKYFNSDEAFNELSFNEEIHFDDDREESIDEDEIDSTDIIDDIICDDVIEKEKIDTDDVMRHCKKEDICLKPVESSKIHTFNPCIIAGIVVGTIAGIGVGFAIHSLFNGSDSIAE